MKNCTNKDCKQINPQPLNNFYSDKRAKDGKQGRCKSCFREYQKSYQKTPQGKLTKQKASYKYRHSRKGKETYKKWSSSSHGKKSIKNAKTKYILSDKNKAAQRRYLNTERAKKVRSQYYKEYYKKFPNRIKARKAVTRAVSSGKLPHINTQKCSICNQQANEYHHHKGYKKEYWLDVLPLCYTHHKE